MKLTSFHCKDRTKQFFFGIITEQVLCDNMQEISHGRQYEYPNAKPSIQLKSKPFCYYKCTLICHNKSAVQIQTKKIIQNYAVIIYIHITCNSGLAITQFTQRLQLFLSVELSISNRKPYP